MIVTKRLISWSVVARWNPETRYQRPGTTSLAIAEAMLRATREILGAL